MQLIAIAGKDGTGKSTLAGKLASLYGNAILLAFATRLRQICVGQGTLTEQEAFAKPTSDTARAVLRSTSAQLKATLQDDEFFGKYLQGVWRSTQELGVARVAIIHDLRYVHEARRVKEDGGHIVFLGDGHLTEEQKAMPSFADLPHIVGMADTRLPAKPSENMFDYLCYNLDIKRIDFND